MTALNILYIAGYGHSGSTLLGRLLDHHPSIVSIGSMTSVASAVAGGSESCSCGATAEKCPHWSPLLSEWRQTQIERDALLQPNRPSWSEGNKKVLSEICQAAGATHVCEATHSKSRPWEYAKEDFANVYVIHLVRDPRGVVHSYQRKNRPILTRIAGLHQNSLVQESNRLRFLNKKNVHYLKVYYEELCDAPEKTLNKIARFAGLSQPFELDLASVQQPHMLGGNRMRRKPLTKIVRQERFVSETSRDWWWRTSLLTLPLLMRYNYPLFRKRMQAPTPFSPASASPGSGS